MRMKSTTINRPHNNNAGRRKGNNTINGLVGPHVKVISDFDSIRVLARACVVLGARLGFSVPSFL